MPYNESFEKAFERVGSVLEGETQSGRECLVIVINDVRYKAFRAKQKRSDRSPDWIVYVKLDNRLPDSQERQDNDNIPF